MKKKIKVIATIVFWLLIVIIALLSFFSGGFLTAMIYKPLLATSLSGNTIGTIQGAFFIVVTFLIGLLLIKGLEKIIDKMLR